LFFLLKILRPFLKSLTQPPPPVEPEKLSGEAALGQLSEHGDGTALQAIQKSIFDENLKKAKQLAVDEPAIVANVVKDWISKNG
jgi:flagellar M-ring protein FliF